MIYNRNYYINQPVPIDKELKTLFKKNSPLIIFEIGACEGEDSIRYANLFPRSKIYAFEPLPENVERITINIQVYKKSNILVFPYALSDTTGSSTFYVSSGVPTGQENNNDWDFGNKSSSLLSPDKHIDLVKFIDFKRKIVVKTITLDEFCQNNQIIGIDFIHMDVQGAELMVLSGGKKSLTSIKAIWLEVSKVTLYKDQPLYEDIEKFMSENNFVLIKDTVDDITGDQLYVSRYFFPHYEKLFPAKVQKQELNFTTILRITRVLKRIMKKVISVI
jgi:FkbM family methyltransferase